MIRTRIATSSLFLAALAAMIPQGAEAQVPRFERTPYAVLSGLRSLDPNTRRGAASGLVRFRRTDQAFKALWKSVQTDPDVSVRQTAAVTLSKMGAKAKAVLAQVAVCDPDPATRDGLSAYSREAGVRCDILDPPMGDLDPLPRGDKKLVAYLAHPYPATRKAAMKSLKKKRSAAGFQAMWKMANNDPVWSLRAYALRAICTAYNKKALPVVKHALTQDPDARVRAEGLRNLGTMKVPGAPKLISASARVEVILEVQMAAIKALAKRKDRKSLRELAGLALSHKSEDARAAALDALGKIKGYKKYAKQIMSQVLKSDSSGKVRAAALKGLSTDSGDEACKARAARVGDPHPDVRAALVSQLARCNAAIARPALERVVRQDEVPKVRMEAAKVLVKLGTSESLDSLSSVLSNDSDTGVRRVCFNAIMRLSPELKHGPLTDVIKSDDDVAMRRSAVHALSKLASAMAVPGLVYALARDRDQEVRLEAAKALGRYSDALAYKVLSRASKEDASPAVRKMAAGGAARSPAQKAWVNALLPQTIDPSPSVRLKAVRQLCQLKVPKTFRALVRALWVDESSAVSVAVARGFADIDHPLVDVGLSVAHATSSEAGLRRAVEQTMQRRVARLNAVMSRTKADNPRVRQSAIEALYPSPFKRVREALERLLEDDPDGDVRVRAATALYMYSDKRALKKLLDVGRKETESKVRSAMVQRYNALRGSWMKARRAMDLNRMISDLRSGNRNKKIRAAYSLAPMKNRQAYTPLKQATKSKDGELRFAAIYALTVFGDLSILAQASKAEKDKVIGQRLLALKMLKEAGPDKIIAAISSENPGDVLLGVQAAAIKPDNQYVHWLVRVALSNLNKFHRLAAVRTLVLFDHPLAQWAIRVAAGHDASKKARSRMWQWAVWADGRSG